jgi:hypothetical protein
VSCEGGCVCHRETTTHHFRANGHGPVTNDEQIAFVVINSDLKVGDTLRPTSFKKKRLRDGNESVARLSYTSLESAVEFIVVPATDRGETVLARRLSRRNQFDG